MTKEFTDTEIAQLNQEFKTANAFTQWKFMQTPEFQRLPLAVRCTIEKKCLTHYFNILTDGMDDWKMPIKATIPVKHFNKYCEACIHFTGTELYQTYCNGDGTMDVAAKGYYMMGA